MFRLETFGVKMSRDQVNPKTGLTDKEELFCEFLISDMQMDVQDAYIKAGYSAKTANANAFRKRCEKKIDDYIYKLKVERRERLGINPDIVINRIDKICESCMQEIEIGGSDKKRMIDYANALKACELHGKHLGMFEKKEEETDLKDKTITVKFE